MTPPATHGRGDARALAAVRLLHTAIWAFFASSILAIPVTIWLGQLVAALWLSVFVWGEVFVLLLNRMRCPLTTLAARYTDDRADNFDICLPRWLARHNQRLFGALFALTQLQLGWALLAP